MKSKSGDRVIENDIDDTSTVSRYDEYLDKVWVWRDRLDTELFVADKTLNFIHEDEHSLEKDLRSFIVKYQLTTESLIKILVDQFPD